VKNSVAIVVPGEEKIPEKQSLAAVKGFPIS
jgi:hypothetical protein